MLLRLGFKLISAIDTSLNEAVEMDAAERVNLEDIIDYFGSFEQVPMVIMEWYKYPTLSLVALL